MATAPLKLFMILLGCKPAGRLTEQHDVFFGIGKSLKDLKPAIKDFWPEAKNIHIDAWREITQVGGYQIRVVKRGTKLVTESKLFFINLGGYRPDEFEEYHCKTLMVADTISACIKSIKQSNFYKNYGFKGANSHLDDKYGFDIDDAVNVEDILEKKTKKQFQLAVSRNSGPEKDKLHIGYLKFDTIK